MAKANTQKNIDRKPRVQIEYEVFTDGAQKKIELPFVVGIMADLSGKPREGDELPDLADRDFEEIDSSNFDTVLKASKPRVNFQVPNTLTGEGNISIDLDFDSMDDFSPAKVAQKVDGLRRLLDARTELKSLLVAMDGRPNAEKIINEMLGNDALLKSLAASAKPTEE